MTPVFPHSGPAWIIQGQATTVRMPAFLDGAEVRPSSGTYTLINDEGTEIVSAAAVTFDGLTATYTVTTSEDLSWFWQERWALVVNGETHTVRRTAWVIAGRPYPGLTLDGLEEIESMVREIALRDDDQEFSARIEGAWQWCMRKLTLLGRRPPRMLDGWQLYDWHRFVTLWMTMNSAGLEYRQRAADYWELAKQEFDQLKLNLDFDDDGLPNAMEENTSAIVPLVLGGAPSWTW